ncbi:MAG: hypothetical protein HY673_04870 [Chloroflexi bacterium]|nr:hypothetical protein [Chloroflexota bacterium]
MAKSRVKIFPQKLLGPRAIRLLEDLVSKGADLEWRNAFEDLIAEMEDSRNYTPEAKALFRLELLLHEADDGFTDVEESYAYARDLLESERLARCEPAGRCPNPPH